MGVLATFDAHANWSETYVCDGLVQGKLKPLGVRWGRWNVPAAGLDHAALNDLLQAQRAELSQVPACLGSHHFDRIQLSPEAIGWPERRHGWHGLHARDGLVAYWVLEGTLLVYLKSDSGHVGILCEAGEWLELPANSSYSLDAGEQPQLDLVVLGALVREFRQAVALEADPGLPSLDGFVETMLELTGHDADEQ